MNVSTLIKELAAHGVHLRSDGPSLARPVWPAECPQSLRRAFARNRRAIASRILPPVFVVLVTGSRVEMASGRTTPVGGESTPIGCCLALVDDQILVWLPRHNDCDAEDIAQRLRGAAFDALADSVHVVAGRKQPAMLRRIVRSGRALCTFDRRIAAALWQASKLPCPVRWIDLRDLARAGSWSEKLDDLIWSVTFVPPEQQASSPAPMSRGRHDSELSRAMQAAMWIAPIRDGMKRLLSIADVYDRIRDHDEPDVLEVDQAINTRGIGLDVPRTEEVLAFALEHAAIALEDCAVATGGMMTSANLLDDAYVLHWLSQFGHRYPNLHAETMEGALRLSDITGCAYPPVIEAVLKARLSLARLPIGSLQRALELVDQRGRVRHHLMYYANRAGEWSSGIAFDQLIDSPALPIDWSAFARETPNRDTFHSLIPADMSAEAALASMVASCFVPATEHVFGICRWRHLKARILAWLIGMPIDVETRQFSAPAAEFRGELVRQLHQALSDGRDTDVGRCRLSITPQAIAVRLPSDRSVHYRTFTPFQEANGAHVPSWLIPPGPETSELRNELDADVVTDDIVRAISRDVRAAALIQCEHAGVPVVVHGSGYIVAELPASSKETALESLVTQLSRFPDWANGMFLTVEGAVTSRLRSSDAMDGTVLRARNGELR